MSGPVTRGAPICFRLPIATDIQMRARAKAHGMSMGKYVAHVVIRAVAIEVAADELRESIRTTGTFDLVLARQLLNAISSTPESDTTNVA